MASCQRERRRSKDLSSDFASDDPQFSQSEEKIKNQDTPCSQPLHNPPNRTDIEKQLERYILGKIDDGPTVRYQLKPDRVNLDRLSDEESKLRRFTIGKRNPSIPNRTLLLVGETGSGKSTLINALVNFVMGVKFEDKVWFEIIEEEKKQSQSNSQTSAVSVYEVFGFEGTVPYSLTIIDTPGYGHTENIEQDGIITHKLHDLFCIPDGVDTIDAVGLVLKSTQNRLDERKAYIFNSVTSIFGKNMENNIVAMMTHSDGTPPENALQALKDINITCARDQNNELIYFLFNNQQKLKSGNMRALRFAFETSEDGLKNFTEFLGKCQPQTLKTTAKVLKERIRLTACIQNYRERVKTIEITQEAISKNREELIKHETAMNDDKNFTILLVETYKVRERIDHWWDTKAVTCRKCEENCHHPGCTWAWDPSWCKVMKNGRCTSCSGKCPVDDHVKENWRYVTKTRTVTKTSEEMKAKYKAEHDEMSTVLEKMEKEMADLQKKKKKCLKEAFNIIEQLESIALNVDSVSTYVHLEFLIEKMEENGDKEKVQKLKVIRDRMDERNKAGAKYLERCKNFFKEVKNSLTL